MQHDKVYENEYYDVVIGEAEITEASAPVYKIINKTWHVCEVETTTLPDVIDYADQLAEALDARYGKEENSVN